MKVLLDIQDNKVPFLMELLENFPFVHAKPLSDEKALLMEEIKEAVQNLNLVREGKLTARPVRELIDEL